MNYKVGDKLLCINSNFSAIKTKIYTIIEIPYAGKYQAYRLDTISPFWGGLNNNFIKIGPILEYILTNPKNLL